MRLILRILLLQVDQLSSSDWLFKLDILEHVLKLYTLAVFTPVIFHLKSKNFVYFETENLKPAFVSVFECLTSG